MTRIKRCAMPEGAALRRYLGEGGYADCYCTDVAGSVSQARFVEAFYTTGVFKIERALLAWFASRPCTDAEARQLALGERSSFAAWHVEVRDDSQLLLCDFMSRTRSWLHAAPSTTGTRLHFGSAVVASRDVSTGERRMGFAFRALLGFHRVYSRVLLWAAVRRLHRKQSRP